MKHSDAAYLSEPVSSREQRLRGDEADRGQLVIEVVPAHQLTDEHRRRWRTIQQNESTLDSAFFHPEFTHVVDSVRGNVEVAILMQAGVAIGFLPFQRGPYGVAQPVVGRLSEFHGVIASPELNWQPEEFIKQSEISAWYFDHLPLTQTRLSQFQWGSSTSPFIDISQGYEHYCTVVKKSSSSAISQIRRKARKLEREQGPLRFEYHDPTDEALSQLVKWKTAQHSRTGRFEFFRHDWVPELLRAVSQVSCRGFSGPVSTLYAGKELIAVHFGLRNDRTMHWWFPAYNVKYQAYSPGLIHMLKLLEQSSELGVDKLDLGKGPERYKAQYKTGELPLAVGGIDRRPWVRRIRKVWHATKRGIRASRFNSKFEKCMELSNLLRERSRFR